MFSFFRPDFLILLCLSNEVVIFAFLWSHMVIIDILLPWLKQVDDAISSDSWILPLVSNSIFQRHDFVGTSSPKKNNLRLID